MHYLTFGGVEGHLPLIGPPSDRDQVQVSLDDIAVCRREGFTSHLGDVSKLRKCGF